jgi:hypothetical protein
MATLSFKTEFPWGEPTYFVPKIWKALREINEMHDEYLEYSAKTIMTENDDILSAFFPVKDFDKITRKIHTIRKDEKNLWYPGRKIHMIVFNRTKNRFQFAPVLECKSVQEICIYRNDYNEIRIFVDYNELNYHERRRLSYNDGFNSIDNFFRFFNQKNFEGKIIHWTDFRY